MAGIEMNSAGGLMLAQALCARLCHELGGTIGSLMTVQEMGAGGGAEAEAIARDAVETLRRRLNLFRALSGGSSDLLPDGLADCLTGALGHGKVRLDLTSLAPGAMVPAPLVPTILAAILLAAEALPRGGAVELAGDPAGELAIIPIGPAVRWCDALTSLLSRGGTVPDITPRHVLAHVLVIGAEAVGLNLSLALAASGGSAPLIVRRRREN